MYNQFDPFAVLGGVVCRILPIILTIGIFLWLFAGEIACWLWGMWDAIFKN